VVPSASTSEKITLHRREKARKEGLYRNAARAA